MSARGVKWAARERERAPRKVTGSWPALTDTEKGEGCDEVQAGRSQNHGAYSLQRTPLALPPRDKQGPLEARRRAESLYTHQPLKMCVRAIAGSTTKSHAGPHRWRGQSHRPSGG